jgi:triacylglycerol lipase
MDWNCLSKLNGFSLDIASFMAHAASDAYQSNLDYLQNRWKCEVRLIDINDSQAIVIDGPHLVIAFRGTEPGRIKDWLSGLDVIKAAWEDGTWVHSGFRDAYHDVRAAVHDECATLRDRELFLVGHSLGGAIADLAAIDLEEHNISPRRIYTYGAPRALGWRAARKSRNMFTGRKFRVVNGNDIVPRVPMCLRFQHTGTLAYIPRSLSPGSESKDITADIEINPGLGYLTYDRILGYRADMLRSHMMANYIQGIDNAQNNRTLCTKC